jgi:hypothetical protein
MIQTGVNGGETRECVINDILKQMDEMSSLLINTEAKRGFREGEPQQDFLEAAWGDKAEYYQGLWIAYIAALLHEKVIKNDSNNGWMFFERK